MEVDSLSPPAMSESSVEIQDLLVPAKQFSLTEPRAARKTTAKKTSRPLRPNIRKACRKTTRPIHESSRTRRRELRSRVIPAVDPTSFTPPLITTKGPLPKALQLEDLPFPVRLEFKIANLTIPLPAPCLVRHEISLALRHDCQSSADPTEIECPATTAEWIEKSSASPRPVLASFTLHDYPLLPPSTARDKDRNPILPQRSELLLRYRILSITNESLFEATFPLSKDRRILTKGTSKPKKTSHGEGKTVLLSWKFDGSVRRQVEEGSEYEGEVMKGLEERLGDLEKEWRNEVVERETINRQLSMDETPLPKLPSGFEVTPPLVSFDSSDSSSGSDSDSSDSDSSDSDQPLWAPVPRYEYVEYTTQAIPYEGQPFEVAPLLRDWEDSEVNNRKLEDASAVAMTYQANSDDDEEKIREEQEWRDKNMISRRALDGLDPGRVHRDSVALDYFVNSLQVDRKELERRMAGQDGVELSLGDVLKEEESIADLCDRFEKRIGKSIDDVQRDSLLRSESSIVSSHVALDRCQLCGNTCCQFHTPVPSFNNPTISPAPPSSQSSSEATCTYCGGHDCQSRKTRSSSEQEVIDEERLNAFAKDYPQLNICTASLVLDCPVDEILERVPENTFSREPAAESPPSLPSSRRNEDRATGESFGYNPCNCTNCSEGCVCLSMNAFCDKFCGCPSSCPRRFRGCKCHKNSSQTRCCEQKHTLTQTQCPCRSRGRVCDPVLCGSHDNCSNLQIQQQDPKATYLGKSTCANGGYGLFMLEAAAPGDYIGVYGGERFEVVTNSFTSTGYGPWQGSLVDDLRISYWYTVDNEHAIDSALTGNLMRFINHRKKPNDNVGAAPVYIDGTHQMGIHATSSLNAGDECFLDYGEAYGKLLNSEEY